MAGEKVVRAIFQLIVLVALASPASAQSLQVFGYAGVLGEWELTASVSGNDSTKDFSGPLVMARRNLYSGWAGRKDGQNPFAGIATIVANVGDVVD
jgi:hypothetical protein